MFYAARREFEHLAEGFEFRQEWRGMAFQLHGHQFGSGETVHDFLERAVEKDGATVDDDDPPAERLDVGHVMAGQQDGRPMGAVVLAEEFAHRPLRDDVQTDGQQKAQSAPKGN